MSKTIEESFWDRVAKKGEDECWEWIDTKNHGYGMFYLNKNDSSAHRYSYELHKGKIPEGLCIDHLCRNKACVNPKHLEAVTLRVNVLRGFGAPAIHARKTHCIHGHPFSKENTGRYGEGRKCKKCASINTGKWYKKNKERKLEYLKKYYQKNKEQLKNNREKSHKQNKLEN